MSDYSTVNYAFDDGVAQVEINRPDAMNSFNATLREELTDALRRAGCEPQGRVVLLSGAGRGFGAGADLKDGFVDNLTDQVNFEYRPIFDAIMNGRRPVISAISGAAAGISLSIALACDLTIMADNAFLLAPFTTIGLIPDGGAHWLLVRQVGYRRAFEMIAEAKRVPADEALQLGLVNRVVAADKLNDAALAWAQALAQRAPLALEHTKRLLRQATQLSFDEVYAAEATAQQICKSSDDCREGIDAFLNKRAPTFKGR